MLRDRNDPDRIRIAGSHCHDRFCVPCSTERATLIAENLLEYTKDKQLRFLTLTIKSDGLSLQDALAKLYTSFSKLRTKRIWKRHVWGGVAFTEIKRRESANRWNTHLHILFDGRYLDVHELVATWWRITGDSNIIQLRKPRNDLEVKKYCCKYASKPFNNSYVNRPEHLDEAVTALHGRKLLCTFGKWRGFCLTETDTEGDWEHLGELNDVMRKAANGDSDSLLLCNALNYPDMHILLDRLQRAPPCEDDFHAKPQMIFELSLN